MTCYGIHFIVIFPQDISKNKISEFFLHCGIDIDRQGEEDNHADRVTPVTLCELVHSYNGMIIIAHCDAESGLLESYFDRKITKFKGNFIQKVLEAPVVYGISYNLESNLTRLKEILNNFNHSTHIIQASDSHSSLEEYKGPGLPLGEKACWVKIGISSYKALQLAFSNNVTHIYTNAPVNKKNIVIQGIAINGGFIRHKDKSQLWAVIPLSKDLNCIIGPRGTGKSTILDIIRYFFDFDNKELGKNIINRFDSVILYLEKDSQVSAIIMTPSSLYKPNYKKYIYKNNKFKRTKLDKGFSKNKYTAKHYFATNYIQGYPQKSLLGLANNDSGVTIIIRGLSSLIYGSEFEKILENRNMFRNNIIEHCKELKNDRKKDKNADLTTDYLEEQFFKFHEAHKKILDFHNKTVNEINQILENKLILNSNYGIPGLIVDGIIKSMLDNQRRRSNFSYETRLEHGHFLRNLFKNVSYNWALPYHIFTYNYEAISRICKIPIDTAEVLCQKYYKLIEPVDVVKLPDYITDFELNVNYGFNSKLYFINRNNLSFGQKAVGILLLILQAATKLGERRTLIIDQPEDDLDNSYIYHSLVKEFHRVKENRQLIIATHNPNIPIAGDAENIIILASNGENGWVEFSGPVEDKNISEKILHILEGDVEAFMRRAEKYGFRLKR